MPREMSLDDLWNADPPGAQLFHASQLTGLPEPVQRYLRHAIAEGAPLASAVRLKMHGEIRLNNRWHPFTAEQVNRWGRGIIWQGVATMNGLPVRGADRMVDGAGSMRWKILGLIPVVNVANAEIARSAAGRLNIEAVWLPSILHSPEVAWTAESDRQICAIFQAHGEQAKLELEMDDQGRLLTCRMPRWGDLNSGRFRYEVFGGYAAEERTFGGYTIPSRLGVGWYFGSDRFAAEGEFFRATLDEVIYR